MKGYHDKKKGIGIIYEDIFLVNGARTAFAKLCGSLANVSPTDLGIFASRAAITKSDIYAADVDQVIMSNIGQSSFDCYFLPRHIGLYSSVPINVPALMVQRICGSGFETISAAADQIALGKATVVLSGGTENMSLAPTLCYGNRMGYPLGKVEFRDFLWEALNDTAAVPMGVTAENIAEKYKVSRSDADIFAKLSVDRAIAATQSNYFADEVVPINSVVFDNNGLKPRIVRLPKHINNFITDENIRPSSIDALATLPSVFLKNGVQTAANSSGIVDGAASVIIAAGNFVREKKIRAMTKVVASTTCAVDPYFMGLGPVPAIRLLLEMTGLKIEDIGLFEINEAFSAQFIGCERELGLNRDICNVNGGAIALGHPLAASGIRLSLTLSREMNIRKVKYGIASACIGGGQGNAILFENINI